MALVDGKFYVCSNSIADQPEDAAEYLNVTELYKRINKELRRLYRRKCRDSFEKVAVSAKISAYEAVKEAMFEIWESGERLYVRNGVHRAMRKPKGEQTA